jgi:GNAT superfamily N-acetyltransferase
MARAVSTIFGRPSAGLTNANVRLVLGSIGIPDRSCLSLLRRLIMALEILTLRQHPNLRREIFSAAFQPPFWPEFLLHDPAAHLYYASPYFDWYVNYAFAVIESRVVVGRAFSVPFAFDIVGRRELPDRGWDEVIRWAHEDQLLGRRATAVCALEISVLPKARGRGFSRTILDAMRRYTRELGFSDLYAPVRPTQKTRQPFMAMRDYVAATRSDGLPQDPWLRVHVRAGGAIVKIAPCAMTVSATLADWTAWTGLRFGSSGPVIVDGGLAPVHVCVEQDHGVYVEPGVWVHHQV